MRRLALTALVAAVVAGPTIVAAAPPAAERPPATSTSYPVKPTGPIAVEYRLAAPPAVGVPLEIVVTARVQAQASSLAMDAEATTPQAVLVTVPKLTTAAGGVYSWTIIVVPLVPEAGYLSVIVAGEIDGVAQARSVTLPLRSAADAAPTPAAAVSRGEALIALPVQESP